MMRKFWIAILIGFTSKTLLAQCAMCKAVVEQGDGEMAESINSGIVYLMAFPYLIVGVAVYFFYRSWKKNNT